MADSDFEKRVDEELRANLQVKSLLPSLDKQVNTLVKDGQTNLSLFLTSLERHSLVLSKDTVELQAKFSLAIVGYNTSSILPTS